MGGGSACSPKSQESPCCQQVTGAAAPVCRRQSGLSCRVNTAVSVAQVLAGTSDMIKNFAVIYLVCTMPGLKPSCCSLPLSQDPCSHCSMFRCSPIALPCLFLSMPMWHTAAYAVLPVPANCVVPILCCLPAEGVIVQADRHPRGARLQHHVRALRPLHHHVLLPKQGALPSPSTTLPSSCCCRAPPFLYMLVVLSPA